MAPGRPAPGKPYGEWLFRCVGDLASQATPPGDYWTSMYNSVGTATRCDRCGEVQPGQQLGCSCMPMQAIADPDLAGNQRIEYGLLGIDYSIKEHAQLEAARFISSQELRVLFLDGRRILVESGNRRAQRLRDWPAAWPASC